MNSSVYYCFFKKDKFIDIEVSLFYHIFLLLLLFFILVHRKNTYLYTGSSGNIFRNFESSKICSFEPNGVEFELQIVQMIYLIFINNINNTKTADRWLY